MGEDAVMKSRVGACAVKRFAAAAIILLFANSPARAEKLIFAWTAVSVFNSPFWIMNDAGLYKEEGLDVDMTYIASSPDVAKATLAGDVMNNAPNKQGIAD